MRLRLLALGIVAATAALPAVPASAYERRCTGTVDTKCYDTDCGIVDCTFYDCAVYLDLLNEPLLDVCVGQQRPQHESS